MHSCVTSKNAKWCHLIWPTRYIELLESVQHRASKMIPGLKHLFYEDRLKTMDLLSLLYRRLRGDAIETYTGWAS